MADPARVPSFTCHEVSGWSMTQIAGWPPADLAAAVTVVSGVEAPVVVGGVVRKGSSTLIRIGPDRCWLIEEGTDGSPASKWAAPGPCVTSLSEGRMRFRMSGSRCREVLAKCIAVDWQATDLVEDLAVQTMIHRVPVLLHRLGRNDFDLYVPRSFAQSLCEWLAGAAREFLVETGATM
jgi:sarcosine oxidase subunit gamma